MPDNYQNKEFQELERLKNEIQNNKFLSEFTKLHLIQFSNELQDHSIKQQLKSN